MNLFNIPMPPGINHLYPSNQKGIRFKSRQLIDFECRIHEWCIKNRDEVEELRRMFHVEHFLGHVIYIQTEFFFKWNTLVTKKAVLKKHDPHNHLKPLYDAISNIIGLDDRYFWEGKYTTNLIPKDSTQDSYVNVSIDWKLANWVA